MPALIEIVIKDEATPAVDRLRQKMKAADAGINFNNFKNQFSSLSPVIGKLQREFSSLLRVAGLTGVFMGGGLVAGLAAATKSIGDFADKSQQLHYSAREIGLTANQLTNLAKAGQALGQSPQTAQQQIQNVGKALRDLQTYGQGSEQFKQLSKARGGVTLANELLQAEKTGGREASMKLLAERMQGMRPKGQAFIMRVFGIDSLSFMDQFKKGKGLDTALTPNQDLMERFSIATTDLETAFKNIQTRLIEGLAPALEQIMPVITRFLDGPGKLIVERFGKWLEAITPTQWDSFFNSIAGFFAGIPSVIGTIVSALEGLIAVVNTIGGWGTTFSEFTSAGAGMVTWIGDIATELGKIAEHADLIPMLSGAIALVGAGGAGGGAGIPGKPGTPSGPAVRTPNRYRSRGIGHASLDNDPENAAPYRVAGGWQPPPSSGSSRRQDEAIKVVGDITESVRSLNTFMSSEGYTGSTGEAGPLAGLRDRIIERRSGGGGGGGGGGYRSGAPRRSTRDPSQRGGGGGGGGTRPPPPSGPAPTSGDASVQAVINERKVIMEQLREPGNRSLAAWAITREMGGRVGRGDVLELLVNRAAVLIAGGANPNGIVERLLKGGFYGPINRYRQKYGRWPAGEDWALEDLDVSAAAVVAGRNRIGGRTDQGMRREVGGGNVANIGGEWYGDHSKTRYGTAAERSIAARRGAHGYVPQGGAPATAPSAAGSNNPPPDATVNIGPVQIGGDAGGLVAPVTGTFGRPGGISYYGAPRGRGGRRPHSGHDMQADNGSRAVAMIDGVVTYSGHDSGYGANVVIKGTDGIYRRYAVHGQNLVRTGQTVRQGQVIGIIGSGHLHYEEIHPTNPDGTPNRVYQEMERNPGRFVSTSHQRGTTNPASTLGLRPGAPLQVGTAIGGETEKQKQAKSQKDFDEYLQKQREQEGPSFSSRARQSRLKLNVRVRGPSGVRTAASSTGVFENNTTIERARQQGPGEGPGVGPG